jgi:hypothetical protein
MAMTVILGFCVDYDVLFATRDFERSVRLGKLSEYASSDHRGTVRAFLYSMRPLVKERRPALFSGNVFFTANTSRLKAVDWHSGDCGKAFAPFARRCPALVLAMSTS